jgi:predicted RNA-binding protein Jag
MKSIIEGANSTIKAIENAWNRAGKPSEFSIKIFEQEEKNFLGMTTKQAKIGIFFKEQEAQESKSRKYQSSKETKKIIPPKKEAKNQQKTGKTTRLPKMEQWTDDMITTAKEWVKKNLIFMGLPNIQFTTSLSNNYLTFHFDSPVIEDNTKEKILFRSFAHLIMASLKNKFKTDFRHLKVILTSS